MMSNAKQRLLALCVMLILAGAGGCQQQAPEPAFDMAKLQADVQEKTRDLYRIHLKLDTAATEIGKAEAAIQEGNYSAADFHVAEAYRAVATADEALLDLGQGLQQAVNLDLEKDR